MQLPLPDEVPICCNRPKRFVMPTRRDDLEKEHALSTSPPPRRVVISRRLLEIAAWLLALAVLGQIFLAGRAVFVSPELWQKHRDFVHTFEWLSPLSVILAYLARATRGAKVLAWLTVVLIFFAYATAGLQSSLGRVGLAALHPVNAALLFWAAIELARRARGTRRASA
jgi:hypothetical protein